MSAQRFSVKPLSAAAEIVGFDTDSLTSEAVRRELYAAWIAHGVLVFREVDSAETHIALSRCFGELETHPYREARSKENPLFIDIGGKALPAFVFDEVDVRINRLPWHRDTAYTPSICKGAMLRMLEVAPTGGETLFADTARAYDDLPLDVKSRLDGLEYRATLRLGILNQTRAGALWKTARKATPEEDPSGAHLQLYDPKVEARYPPVVHPAVLVHPDSGRKCIFLSPTYVDYFLGMTPPESDALLHYLVDHMTNPRYVYEHRWSVNDAVLWDNRRVMHAAMGIKPGDRRRGLRTTLAANLEIGRYCDSASDAVVERPLAD